MKYKIGDIVVLGFPDENFFENIINRKPRTIVDIVNGEYVLSSKVYVEDEDIISLNVAINNLESLISKGKKQLKLFKKLKQTTNVERTNQ